MANEQFFELNESSLQDILVQFHELLSDNELNSEELLQVVSHASRQIMMPPLTTCTDAEVAQYTTMINQIIPNLASESAYIQSLSLAFLPRLAVVLTSGQLTDLVENVLAALQIYIQSGVPLSAQCAAICIHTLATDILLKFDSIHISIPSILVKLFKQLKQLQVGQDGIETLARSQGGDKTPPRHDTLLTQTLLATTVVTIFKSKPLEAFSKADDVSLLTSVIGNAITCIKAYESQNTKVFLLLLQLLCEQSFINCLVRLPNYVSSLVSYCANLVLQCPNVQVRNKARGFLTALFILDWFLGDDVGAVLGALRLDLSEPDNRVVFKRTMQGCFDNYITSYGVPQRAVVPLSIQAF